MKRTTYSLIAAFCCAATVMKAAELIQKMEPGNDLRLTGLVWVDGASYAAFTIPQTEAGLPKELLLQEQEAAYDVEVVKIYPTTRRVELRYGDETRRLTMPPLSNETRSSAGITSETKARVLPAGPIKRVDISLRQMGLSQVLEVYALVSNRKVLAPEDLPPAELSLGTAPRAPSAEALQALDAALAKHGIVMTPLETRYELALPATRATQVLAQLPAALPPLNPTVSLPGTNSMMTNMIQGLFLSNVPLEQALELYLGLAGRADLQAKLSSNDGIKQLVPRDGPSPAISIKVGAMTRREALHAMDIVLALNGFKVEFDSAAGVKVMRLPSGLSTTPKPK